MFDNIILVYKFIGDVYFYAVADVGENELILASVLQALCDSIGMLLRNVVDKKSVLESYDLVLLAMDEIVDGGIILEIDPQQVAQRVTMRGEDGGASLSLSDQTLSQAFASAKEQFAKNLLR